VTANLTQPNYLVIFFVVPYVYMDGGSSPGAIVRKFIKRCRHTERLRCRFASSGKSGCGHAALTGKPSFKLSTKEIQVESPRPSCSSQDTVRTHTPWSRPSLAALGTVDDFQSIARWAEFELFKMSAPEGSDEVAVKKGAGCTGSGGASSGIAQTSENPSPPPKEEKRKGMETELFHSSTLEEMLRSSPFSLSPDTTAGVLSSLLEASPSGQGLAGALPASFLSQLAGQQQPEGVGDATLPAFPLGLHSPSGSTLPRTPLTPSQQTSTGGST